MGITSYEENVIGYDVYQEMLQDCGEIEQLLLREKNLDNLISVKNKESEKAKLLQTIPSINYVFIKNLNISSVNFYYLWLDN